MPRVVFSPAAIRDLERLRSFLRTRNPAAAKRAGETIIQGMRLLGTHPRVGRLIEGLPDEYLREWLIGFGDSGYVAWYRIDGDMLTILAIRHQKEAGYSQDS